MPIIKSAKKRVKTTEKATVRNSKTKRLLRSAVKDFTAALKSGQKVAETHAKAQSALDIAVKKGLLHKNKAARKKQQLANMAKAAGKKVVGGKAVKKTAPTKKTTQAKKTPTKKSSTKKNTKK